MKAALPLTLLLLSACGSGEPESAANAFARTSNELIAREAALNAQVENELAQTQQRLESEASQQLNSLNAAAAAANAASDAAPAPAAAQGRSAAQSRRR
jgi:small-conductance mechanosensitive channel